MMGSALVAVTAAPQAKGDPVAVIVMVGVLILVVVGAGLLVMAIRRRLLQKHDPRASASSFLDELRDMHRRGQVSDQEFQAARASLLAKVTGAPVAHPPASPRAAPSTGARVAPPGFDLTGAPLPRPITERPDPAPGA